MMPERAEMHGTSALRGSPQRTWSRGLRLGRQAFWAIMLAAHAPGWLAALGAGASDADLLRCLVLTLSQLLFVLKLADVPWLRLPRTRRAYLIATLAVALLHADVARSALTDEPHPTAPPAAAWAVAAAALLAIHRPRANEAVRPRVLRQRAHTLVASALERVAQLALTSRQRQMVRPCPVTRAPPAPLS